jgi:hypothetical protein
VSTIHAAVSNAALTRWARWPRTRIGWVVNADAVTVPPENGLRQRLW